MADDEVLRVISTGSPPRLAISGEADERSYPALLKTLAATDGHPEIHIDLSGLRYCDLAGLRAILRLTPPSSGSLRARRVVLHAVPSQFAEILHILGWDSLPGIVLDD